MCESRENVLALVSEFKADGADVERATEEFKLE